VVSVRVGAARAGFSLAEALVALVLVGVAVLSLGGAAAAAARLLREAALAQGAAQAAEAVFDSVAAGSAGSGTVLRGAFTIDWAAIDSGAARHVRVDVRYASGSAARWLRIDGIGAATPPEASHAP
jgi:Tfp pilus assembly protein PilV